MPWGVAIGAAAGLGSALIGASASEDATAAQTQAAQAQLALQKQIFQQNTTNEKPYLAAGGTSLTALMQGLGLSPGSSGGVANGSINAPFTAQQFQQSPGYQFQMQQGTQAINNAASATGGVNSGNNLKALLQYGQGIANQDYQQAYANYTGNQNNIFNRLYGVTNVGQNAAVNQASAGQNYATGAGNAYAGIGNAQAAGAISQGQTLSNLFNNPNLQSLFQSGVGSLTGSGAYGAGTFGGYNVDPYSAYGLS